MSVVLEAPISMGSWYFGGDICRVEAVLEGPAYFKSGRGAYWHRTRSMTRYPLRNCSRGMVRMGGYAAARAWCGVGGFLEGGKNPGLGADAPLDDGPVCATCEGRAVGAGHPVGRLVPAGPVTFAPTSILRTPRTCPGWKTLPLAHDNRRGVCDVCGDEHPLRGGGGAWTPWYGLQKHAPGPGLILGCEFHGWRSLVRRREDGAVMCRCEVPFGEDVPL